MLVGRSAPPEKRMGHAGALVGSARESAAEKLAALAGRIGFKVPGGRKADWWLILQRTMRDMKEEEIPAGTIVHRAVATGPLKEEIVDGKTRVTYGVQTGDTLWAISQRFNCTVDELRQWNSLSKRKKALQVGTVLVVWPKPKTASVLEQELTVHSAK